MRIHRIPYLLLVCNLFSGLLAGCQLGASTSVPSASGEVPVSLLISLNAQVEIKREGWNDFLPIGFGTFIYPTDLLKPSDSTNILCPDLHTIKTLNSLGRNACPLPDNSGLTSHGELVFSGMNYEKLLISAGTRNAIPAEIPYILYPRSTKIVEGYPILRWNDTNAQSYTVEIRHGSKTIWQQADVSGTQLEYPASKPPLAPGNDYLLVVTDNSTRRSSREDPNKGLGFQVVSSDQLAAIDAQQQAILNLEGLDPTAQKLALALYNSNNGLWGQSVALLQEIVRSQPEDPALYLYLGRALEKTKLSDEEQSAYQTAFDKAKNLNDLESMADALSMLWAVTHDQAYFDQALDLYQRIGDQDKVEKLQDVRP